MAHMVKHKDKTLDGNYSYKAGGLKLWNVQSVKAVCFLKSFMILSDHSMPGNALAVAKYLTLPFLPIELGTTTWCLAKCFEHKDYKEGGDYMSHPSFLFLLRVSGYW